MYTYANILGRLERRLPVLYARQVTDPARPEQPSVDHRLEIRFGTWSPATGSLLEDRAI